MNRTEKKSPGYTKLHMEVYRKTVDLLPLLARFDRQKIGLISQKDFVEAVRVVGLQLSDKEIYDIVRSAEVDAKGDIYYRNLIRSMERTQPDLPDTSTSPATATADQALYHRKTRSDLAHGVLSFHRANSYVGFNRFLINGVFTESSFLEFVSQTTRLDSNEIRELWTAMPSMLSPQVFLKWAQSFDSQQGLKTISVSQPVKTAPPPPAILSRLRNTVQTHGDDYVKAALCTYTYLRLNELQEIFGQLDACKTQKEFEEFRLWGVNEGVIKLVGGELAFEGSRFVGLIEGFAGEGRLIPGNKSQLGNVVETALRDMLSAQLASLKRLLVSETGSDSVTEKHIRRIMQLHTPSLTPQNVSLLLNAMTLVDPPVHGRPFRNFSATEVLNVLSNWESVELGSIPPFPGIPSLQDKLKTVQLTNQSSGVSVGPVPVVAVDQQQWTIGQPALIPPHGPDWEQSLYTKLHSALSPSGSLSLQPLHSAFHKVDQEHLNVLSLDRFHWVLKHVFPFLSDGEVYHLVQVALETAGSVNERKTADIRKNLGDYLENVKTINRVLFPDGSQYVISYTFFCMHLEAKIKSEVSVSEELTQ